MHARFGAVSDTLSYTGIIEYIQPASNYLHYVMASPLLPRSSSTVSLITNRMRCDSRENVLTRQIPIAYPGTRKGSEWPNSAIYPKQQPDLQLPLAAWNSEQQQAYTLYGHRRGCVEVRRGGGGRLEKGAFPIVLFIRSTWFTTW